MARADDLAYPAGGVGVGECLDWRPTRIDDAAFLVYIGADPCCVGWIHADEAEEIRSLGAVHHRRVEGMAEFVGGDEAVTVGEDRPERPEGSVVVGGAR